MGFNKTTEEDIKTRYITPNVQFAGWDFNKYVRMEYYFTDGRIRVVGDKVVNGKKKKADYVLFYNANFPLAVIEAKNKDKSVGDGMQQAIEYAKMLDIPFAYSTNGYGFLEHDRLTGKEREFPMDEFPTKDELYLRYKIAKGLDLEQEEIMLSSFYYDGRKSPRYYQRVAINRTIEAIAKGQNRIMLVMATGTGKTYTAFQIIYRLREAYKNKRILFLADRNILVDQTMQNDFKPFDKVMTKISGKNIESSYELYLGLYQQLIGRDGKDYFKKFNPDFFDLIVIDEAHRGSAKQDSAWRRILDYFSSAIHIGLTATPKETEEVSNSDYFGEPVYEYSLRQGISDGFLAPYKVIRVGIDVDLVGYRPTHNKVDAFGEIIDDREYTSKDFDKNLIIDDRTKTVAKRITEYLKKTDRFSKTIVFCIDIEHAERMRQALVNENSDLIKEDSRYVMRITGDSEEGKAQLDNFIDEESKYPTIVTTSKLLTTGVDCKTCKLIVLDSNIKSMIEFKQIIGRGTRLSPNYGKEFFTIMDFRNVTNLFADREWDAEPEETQDVGANEEIKITKTSISKEAEEKEEIEEAYKFRINDINVSIINEKIQYLDEKGKLISGTIEDYSKQSILTIYPTLNDFIQDFKLASNKEELINELKDRGLLIEALRATGEYNYIDDFDLICSISYDEKALTRYERVNNIKDCLLNYSEKEIEVLNLLLEYYIENNKLNLEDIKILNTKKFESLGSSMKICKIFGTKHDYVRAVKQLINNLH